MTSPFLERFRGCSAREELVKLARLIPLEARLTLASGRFAAYLVIMLTPLGIVVYIAGLSLLPAAPQNAELLRLTYPGRSVSDIVDLLGRGFERGIVGGLLDLASGYWLSLPSLVVVAIVVSEFIAGGRSSGSLNVIATKPTLRSVVVASKLLVFSLATLGLVAVTYIGIAALFSAAFFPSPSGVAKALQLLSDDLAKMVLVTWEYCMVVAGVTLLISVFTKRSFLPILGVLGYYFGVAMGSSLLPTIIPGGMGRRVAESLFYLNFENDARLALTHWLNRSPQGAELVGFRPSPETAFLSMHLTLVLSVLLSLLILEHRDLD